MSSLAPPRRQPPPASPELAADQEAERSEAELERLLVIGLTFVFFVGMAYFEYGKRGTDLTIRELARVLGMLVAGPLTILFLVRGEKNKLITGLVVALALASSSLGALRGIGSQGRWLLLAVAAVIGIDRWLRSPGLLRTTPQLLVLVWGGLAMASASYAIREPQFAFEKSVTVFMLFGAAMLYAFDRFGTPEKMATAVATLGKLAAGFFAANFLLVFSSIGYLGGRYRGMTENPNTLGGFFTITMAAVLWLFFSSRRRRGTIMHQEPIIYLGMVLGTVLLIVLSASRAGLLGAFVGGAVYLFVAERHYFVKCMLAAIPAAMLALVFMPTEIQERTGLTLEEIHEQELQRHLLDTSASGRFEAWELAGKYIGEHPLLGTGWGTTRFIFSEYHDRYYFTQHHGEHVHNSYIELAMELGVPFAAVFCGILLLLIGSTIHRLRHIKRPEDLATVGALLGAMCGGLVGAFWESWLIAVGSFGAFSFWLVVGILARVSTYDESDWQAQESEGESSA